MKTYLNRILVAMSLIFATTSAHAIFIEPFAGVAFGVGDTSGSTGIAGGRAGIGLAGPIDMGVQGNYNFDAESFTAAAVVVADLPVVRGWIGYNLVGEDVHIRGLERRT